MGHGGRLLRHSPRKASMHTSELTPAVLRDLRRERRYPALSLLMPTHRHRPETAQDPIRLRNLLVEAKKRIGQDPKVDRSARLDLEGQLDRAAAEVDFEHSGDGLLILVAPGESQNWLLASPSPVPDRLVVAETFLTRNLVAARIYARPYWVLVISEEASHLWEGSGRELAEADGLGLGFPLEPEIPDPQDAVPGPNFGTRPGPQREERMRQYLRTVDAALGRALDHERRPVFLVGTGSALALFDDLSEHSVEFAGQVARAGLDKAPAHELAERLRPALDAHADRLDAEALDRLGRARGQRRFAGGLSEVWEAVSQGRGSLLLVEEHCQVTGRISLDHLHVVADGESAPDAAAGAEAPGTEAITRMGPVEEDVIDQLVEMALDMETEVRFVPDGSLAEDGQVALVLRY
jgi:Bacterial archaeo-eukaryotic release factor family 3